MKGINIGIALGIQENASIWSNGAAQHGFFLYELLKQIDFADNVWILCNLTKKEQLDKFFDGMSAATFRKNMFSMEDKIEELDLLIELTDFVGPHYVDILRKNNGKLVSYKLGPDYMMSVESSCFGAHEGWVPHPFDIQVDELWTNPQHANTSKSFNEFIYKAKAYVLPHVWAPIFLEQATQRNSVTKEKWPFKKLGENFSINIFEPNINIVKSSIIPFCAAAKFYEKEPTAVTNIYMLNTLHIVENELFKRIVTYTPAFKAGIVTGEPRWAFPDFAAQYNGIILCHQWENGLNYLYYEALYGGYPLVHNSPFLKDVGYYYSNFDIDAAVEALDKAYKDHDKDIKTYREKAAEFLETVSPYSNSVIKAYSDKIKSLFDSQ